MTGCGAGVPVVADGGQADPRDLILVAALLLAAGHKLVQLAILVVNLPDLHGDQARSDQI